MPRESFPLTLGISTILTTALGLAAAALGIKWGTAPLPGDALPDAWLYVNVLWMLDWLVLWPAVALRPGRRSLMPPTWEWAAILLAALPALAVAAYVSGITRAAAADMLALQSAASLFALALIQRHPQFPRATAALATLAAALTFAGPVAAFLWTQFLPLASRAWFVACPLLAVGRAAGPTAGAPLWISTLLLGASGLLLLLLSPKEKAPGTEMPRA